ncbi:P-loop containing nucleoside triphosphate hydrolase protein [Spinellus fusiger]|nr:P-loop containing nucleoside triphosphate hydrolase protein [Spinellus fusiger]
MTHDTDTFQTIRKAHAKDPSIRVISVLGRIGTGKSSLLNAIADEFVFNVGEAPSTTEITTGVVKGEILLWKTTQVGKQVHLIDTPGFCDSKVENHQHVVALMRYLRAMSLGVSVFMVVISIHDIRLDASTQIMFDELHALLGKEFWNYVMFVFTHADEDVEALERNKEAVLDPQDGIVKYLCELYQLSPKTFVPNILFISTLDLATSSYSQRQIRLLYNAVNVCEVHNHSKRFTCPWFKHIFHAF